MASITTISPQRYKTRRHTELKDQLFEALCVLYCASPRQLAEYIREDQAEEVDMRTMNAALLSMLRDDKHLYPISRYPFKDARYMKPPFLYGVNFRGLEVALEMGLIARRFENRDHDHENLVTETILAYKEFARVHGFGFDFKREGVDYNRLINPDALIYLTTPKENTPSLLRWNARREMEKGI